MLRGYLLIIIPLNEARQTFTYIVNFACIVGFLSQLVPQVSREGSFSLCYLASLRYGPSNPFNEFCGLDR